MRNHWQELLKALNHKPGEKIIDVGGAHDPVPIADIVLDICNLGKGGKETTILDISSELWPFEDNEFDIAVCSQTLEDLTCPSLAIREMSRVAQRGVIEVPHRGPESVKQEHPRLTDFAEDHVFTYGAGHHKWLIEQVGEALIFTPKLYYLLMRYPIPKWTGPGGIRYIWNNQINFHVVHDVFDDVIATNYRRFREDNEEFWK